MTTSKRRPGKPRRAGSVSNAYIQIRVTPQEHQRWREAAEAEGVSLAEVIRGLLSERLRPSDLDLTTSPTARSACASV